MNWTRKQTSTVLKLCQTLDIVYDIRISWAKIAYSLNSEKICENGFQTVVFVWNFTYPIDVVTEKKECHFDELSVLLFFYKQRSV